MNSKVSDRWLTGVIFLLGLFIVFLCYSSGLGGPFLLDDDLNFVDKLQDTPVNGWYGFLNFIVTNTSGMFGRPVSMFSFAITGSLHEIEPWPFKFHNLLIHMSCGVVTYFLTKKIVRVVNDSLDSRQVTFIALLTAFVWMLHPLQVSTVLYAVQRMAQLSGLFTLLALLVYIHGRQLLETRLWRARIYLLILFPLAGLLSVLSKENGALIPFYIILIEAFLFRTPLFSRVWKREQLFYTLAYGWLPILLATLYVIVRWDSLTNYSTRYFTMGERLLTEVHVVAMYIKMILLPRLSDMSLFHDVALREQLDISTLLILAAFVLVPAGLWMVRKRAPLLIFGVGWFFFSHVMESTFIGLELVFEHRNYIAMLGFILPITYYIVVGIDARRLQVAVAALVLVMMSGLTTIRAREWSDLDLMMEVAIQEQPGSLRAHTEYANVLINRLDYIQALDVLARAAEIAPYDYGAIAHQIMLRCQLGLGYDDLMDDLREKAPLLPATPYSLGTMESLINVVTIEICTELPLSDLGEINALMLENPENQTNNEYLSYILRQKGFLDFGLQKYREGADTMLRAYSLRPSPLVLSDLIGLLISFGYVEDAEIILQQYREVNEQKHGIYTDKLIELENQLEEARPRVEALRQERLERQELEELEEQ